MMSFAAWHNLESVFTLFAMWQPLGITGLPKVAIVKRQMIISRTSNMPSSILRIPLWSLSLQGTCPPVLSYRISWYVYFLNSKQQYPTGNIPPFFLHELLAFYEQASSRTSWLKAFKIKLFLNPCNPCNPNGQKA